MPVIKRAAAWTGAYRLINIEAGVTYTFSAWVKSDEARSVAIYAIGSGATATITPNNKNITTTTSWERVSFTFTCSTSGTVALRFENTSASTTNYTYISGYQLEKNSSMTSFEPYVGGTASPNPDYPQEVQTVTGEQTVTVVGKNLCNPSDIKSVFVYAGFNRAAYGVGDTSAIIPVLPNTDYTISTLAAQARYRGGFSDSIPVSGGGDVTVYNGFNKDSQLVSVTTNSGDHKYLIVNATDFTKIQIEKNNQATSYAPYQGGSYPVNLGKNLFDKDNFPSVDGFIRADNYTLTSSASNKTTYIKANPNTTYTFSGFTLGVALVVGAFNKVPALGDVANVRVLKGASDTTVTITTGASDSYIAFMYKTSSDELDTSAFQIEKGSSASSFAPYFTPIELCKIGTYQDYIYKSGEDWYVHKETQKNIFNGSENWADATATTGYTRCYVSSGGTVTVPDGYCDEFISRGSSSHGAYEYMWAQQTTNTVYIQVDNSRLGTASLANFKTWLGSHPASVYRTLATPADTQITNSALIAQLEALAGAKIMVDGGTATVTSQYLPATLTTAYNSNSGYIDYIYDGTNFVKVR